MFQSVMFWIRFLNFRNDCRTSPLQRKPEKSIVHKHDLLPLSASGRGPGGGVAERASRATFPRAAALPSRAAAHRNQERGTNSNIPAMEILQTSVRPRLAPWSGIHD